MQATTFYFERLVVYQKAMDAFLLADAAARRLPSGWPFLADQLRRAALSIGANIAEGATEFARPEQKRFYRIAKRSAAECVFFTDAMVKARLVDAETVTDLRARLGEIAAMLTAMIKR